MLSSRAGEPDNFLAAPATDFFPSGSGSWFFPIHQNYKKKNHLFCLIYVNNKLINYRKKTSLWVLYLLQKKIRIRIKMKRIRNTARRRPNFVVRSLLDIRESTYFRTHWILIRRAGEPANFLAAPAPPPDFFFKRLRLLIVFPRGSGSWYFFSSGSGSGSGSKGPKTPGSDRLLLLGKIFFSPQTSKVKLQKNVKQVKLLFFNQKKLNILPKKG